MALICNEHRAICPAVAMAPTASTSARRTRSGCPTHHSRTRIPPIEPPTTADHCSIPRWSARAASTDTWSRMVTNGKREPHATPFGAGEAGPVVPWQPPSTFGHTTKYRSVSMGAPGPIIPSHHPGVG